MEDRPPRSVVLVKDGKWLVPPEERPANWESILPEGSASGRREVSRAEVPTRIESLPRPALAEHPPEPTQEAVAESVASVAQATEAQPVERPPRQHQAKTEPWNDPGWKELSLAVKKSGKAYGAEPDLIKAALVLCAGMYTRTGPVIRKMTGITNEKKIVKRCYELGLWTRDRSAVVLGEMKPEHGDMEFWLIAMAANGSLHRFQDGTFMDIKKYEQGKK